ncbi:MAG TPA: hypothetical protein PLK28_14530 [Candidatus Rifleibacterium sp.]|nr:hypothetical protein [Candidatus Rifleibacterium sp.]
MAKALLPFARVFNERSAGCSVGAGGAEQQSDPADAVEADNASTMAQTAAQNKTVSRFMVFPLNLVSAVNIFLYGLINNKIISRVVPWQTEIW